MRKMFKSATLGAVALTLAVAAGCQDKPQSVTRVDQSVLPASAKAMFAQGAEITEVQEIRYTKGSKQYRVHYTIDGKKKIIHINDADETKPTGVFQHAAY